MGNCCSRLTAKLVLPHELRIGDHIVIKNCCSSIHAIYVDDDKDCCIYLDTTTGYVTETFLSTICNDRNKLYKYNYSRIQCMSSDQVVANAQYFALRGQFTKCICCFLSSSYQFAYNCKINKYASITNRDQQHQPNDNHIPISNNDKALLVNPPTRSTLITPDALRLCMENQIISTSTSLSSNIIEINELNDTNNHHHDAGSMNQTIIKSQTPSTNKYQRIINRKNDDDQNGLKIKIDRIYDSHNLLIQRLNSMDKELKTLKSKIPKQNATTADSSLRGSPSPITMDTSMTLTPIRSKTGNRGTHVSGHYGSHLGVITIPDICIDSNNTSSTCIGGEQFNIVDASASMSISTVNKNNAQ